MDHTLHVYIVDIRYAGFSSSAHLSATLISQPPTFYEMCVVEKRDYILLGNTVLFGM